MQLQKPSQIELIFIRVPVARSLKYEVVLLLSKVKMAEALSTKGISACIQGECSTSAAKPKRICFNGICIEHLLNGISFIGVLSHHSVHVYRLGLC